VSDAVIEELKRIIAESEILKEEDKDWPPADKVGRQELEIFLNKERINFIVRPYHIISHSLLDFEVRLVCRCLQKQRS